MYIFFSLYVVILHHSNAKINDVIKIIEFGKKPL